jgi:hypothetical protein
MLKTILAFDAKNKTLAITAIFKVSIYSGELM